MREISLIKSEKYMLENKRNTCYRIKEIQRNISFREIYHSKSEEYMLQNQTNAPLQSQRNVTESETGC